MSAVATRPGGFRIKLLVGVMLVIVVATALALWLAQHHAGEAVQDQIREKFRGATCGAARAHDFVE